MNRKVNKGEDMKVVLLDLDDVVLDTEGGVELFLNERNNTENRTYLSRGQYWDLQNTPMSFVHDKMTSGDFYQKYVKFLDRSIDGLKLFFNDDRLITYFVTAEPSLIVMQDKKLLLEESFKKHGIDANLDRFLLRCLDKSMIRGHFLVDDYIENIKACDKYMTTILFYSKDNKNEVAELRVNNLVDAYNLIKEIA